MSYVFDRDTITLYNQILNNQPIERLQGARSQAAGEFTPLQRNEYNFWLSLPQSQKDEIIAQVKDATGPTVINVTSYDTESLSINAANNLLAQGKITEYDILNVDYVQLLDTNGNYYVVFGQYDVKTNRILPHDA